jgi:hypothetical protein
MDPFCRSIVLCFLAGWLVSACEKQGRRSFYVFQISNSSFKPGKQNVRPNGKEVTNHNQINKKMERKVQIWNFRATTLRSNRLARLGILTLVSFCIVVMLRTNFRQPQVNYMASLSEVSAEDIQNEVQSSPSSANLRPGSKLKSPKSSEGDENDQVKP